ncbi:MAG: hypothetical protein AAFR52_07410 [Pseudomonadota bacterium]
MYDDLTIFRGAQALGNYAASRQRLVAENVAQASTPGYEARDMMPFDGYIARHLDPAGDMASPGPGAMRATRAGHFGFGPAPGIESATMTVPAAPNGNSSALETQAVMGAEAEAQHRMALAVWQKAIDLMRLGLSRPR